MTIETRGNKEFKDKGEQALDEDKNPIVVYRACGGEDDPNWVGAHAVPKKGADHYAAQRFANDLKWMGYGRIFWKSDQEPSIIALRDRVKEYCGAAVTGMCPEKMGIGNEESPVGESRSNGEVENAVKSSARAQQSDKG